MPAQLRPLTQREQRVAELAVKARDVILLAVAALIGAIARGLVSAYCNAPGGGPEGGAAGSYCSAVHPGSSWGAFVVGALMIAAVLWLVGGRWRRRRAITVGVLLVALVANTAIVATLPGYIAP